MTEPQTQRGLHPTIVTVHPAIITEVRVRVSDLPGLCLEIVSVLVPIITSLFGEHPLLERVMNLGESRIKSSRSQLSAFLSRF